MARVFYLIKAVVVILIPTILMNVVGKKAIEDIIESPAIVVDSNIESINYKINLVKQQPDFDQKILTVAESFGGTPYNSNVLKDDSLTTRIDSLDCWTFVENTIAIALASTTQQGDYDLYKQILIRVRYRNGINKGYGSRIHYFLEWKQNLEKRQVASDYSEYLGGVGMQKKLSYISNHAPDSLKNYLRIIEKNLSADGFYYIPPSNIDDSKMIDGDIIAFVTSKPQLDVEHMGIIKKINGVSHIIHASTASGICISAPLKEYMERNKTQLGIILVRVYKSNLK